MARYVFKVPGVGGIPANIRVATEVSITLQNGDEVNGRVTSVDADTERGSVLVTMELDEKPFSVLTDMLIRSLDGPRQRDFSIGFDQP